MTKAEIDFINRLSKEDLLLFQNILNQDRSSVLEYLNKELEKLQILDMVELTKDIPITYLPVMGASLDYYHKFGLLKSVYDYLEKNEKEKKNIRNLGSTKILVLDYAVDFVLKHLNDKIKFCKQNGQPVISGRALLDEDLKEKEELILKQIPDIYQFLSQFGTDYVFSSSTKAQCLDYLLPGADLNKQEMLIRILARYSSLEDLEDNNIMSFQKFIKQQKMSL